MANKSYLLLEIIHPITEEVRFIHASDQHVQVAIAQLVAQSYRGSEGDIYDFVRELGDQNMRPFVNIIRQERLSEPDLKKAIKKLEEEYGLREQPTPEPVPMSETEETSSKIDLAKSLRREGVSHTKIAKELGISYKTYKAKYKDEVDGEE